MSATFPGFKTIVRIDPHRLERMEGTFRHLEDGMSVGGNWNCDEFGAVAITTVGTAFNPNNPTFLELLLPIPVA